MRTVLAVPLVLALAAPCGAKDIAPGEYVRLKLADGRITHGLPRWVEGQVLDLAPGSVRVLLDDAREVTVPYAVIKAVDLRLERHSRLRGTAIGFGIGLGIGLMEEQLHPCEGECEVRGFGTLFLASLGTLIGTVASPGYRWQRGEVGLSVKPALGRSVAGLSVAVSF